MSRTSSSFNLQQTLGRPAPLEDGETWWLGLDRDTFYARVSQRREMLSARYGSTAVSLVGPLEPGFTERARRAKQIVKAKC